MATKQFAVIFDMDGTMVNNTPYHFKSWQTMFKKYHKGELTEQTYKHDISGTPIIDTVSRIFAEADEDDRQALVKEKEGIYRELYAPYMAPVDGLENLLIELKDSGVKLAIASSATVDDIDFVLEHVKVRQFFDVIVDGHRVSKGKPNPQIFLKAAADLGIQPEDCVVFEDSLAGITAGKAAGMKVIGITTAHPAGRLQATDLVINDFTELNLQRLAALFTKDER